MKFKIILLKLSLMAIILITLTAGAIMVEPDVGMMQSDYRITDQTEVSLPMAVFLVGVGGLLYAAWKSATIFGDLRRDVMDLKRDVSEIKRKIDN